MAGGSALAAISRGTGAVPGMAARAALSLAQLSPASGYSFTISVPGPRQSGPPTRIRSTSDRSDRRSVSAASTRRSGSSAAAALSASIRFL